MTDAAAPDPISGTPWSAAFIVSCIAMAFTMALIVWLVLYGQPANSLHASALAWAFALLAGLLVGFGFGAISNLVPFKVVAK